MAQILNWEDDYRFVGHNDEPLTHITTMDNVSRWIETYVSGDTIPMLCGKEFRPLWSGTALLDTDTLCVDCEALFMEQMNADQT